MPLLPDTVLPTTSDLLAAGQMVDQGSFIHPGALLNGLQDLNSLPSTAASAHPGLDPMEASNLVDVQNQLDPQSHQSCEYDLLSSVPCKSVWRLFSSECKCVE